MGDSSSPDITQSRGESTASVVSSIQCNENGSSMGDGDYDSDDDDDDDVAGQLNLHKLALVGRRKEYSLLNASYQRIQKGGEHPSEVVLIGGMSGTGKSKLAESIREPVTLERHGFFVSGKFDQLRNEPYGAFAEAFSDLCDLIAQDTIMCAVVAEALKDDISVLSKVVPNISNILPGCEEPWQVRTTSNSSAHHHGDSTTHHAQANFTQLKIACRTFLGAVANKEHPVVLLLDDIQWADSASLGIIESIMTDMDSKYVLMIGTYRSDDAACAIQNLLDSTSRREACLRCTSIQLENFSHNQVTLLIAECTAMRADATGDLAALVVHRTAGNPLFVIRFLEMLEYNELLVYDTDSSQWTWSIDRIQERTISSENVVDVVKARIRRLEDNDQAVLRLAALLGFSFDGDVIKAAAMAQQSLYGQQCSSENVVNRISARVDEALRVAENQGLIESTSTGFFKFCHDSYSDCLYSMTPPGKEASSAHLLLARVMQKMKIIDHQVYVYAIADQLNRAKTLINSDDDRLDCAECNLRAAKLALKQSAFSLAAEFAQQGLAVIEGPTKWDAVFYACVLDLYCVGAEALYCCGRCEESDANLMVAFEHATSVSDITQARLIYVYSLGAQGRLDEAVEAAYDTVRDLGVNIARNPTMGRAVYQLVKTKSNIRRMTDEQLLSRPTQQSKGMKDAAIFLGIATHYASIAGNVPCTIVSSVALMRLTLSGHCLLPTPFCLFGILEASLGNISGAVRMERLATRISESQHDEYFIPGDLCTMHTFLAHWRAPMHKSLELFQQAYSCGLKIGVFDVAFMAVSGWMQTALFCGYPLGQLEPYMRAYCGQMNEFDHKNQTHLALPYWQLCLNLIGLSDDPTHLTGDAMDEVAYRDDVRTAEVQLAPQTLNFVRIVLCCHFGYPTMLQTLIREHESFDAPPAGLFAGRVTQYVSCFYVGLAHAKLYRTFVIRRNKRKARKAGKKLRKLTLNGCPNTKPLCALMEAEVAAFGWKQQNVKYIESLYLGAIREAAAVENSFLEATASERAALFCQASNDDQASFRQYSERAVELYDRSGAFAKVEYMEKQSRKGSVKIFDPPEIIDNSVSKNLINS